MYAAHRNVFEFVFVLLQMLDDLELTNTSTNTRAKLTYAHTLSWVTALVPMENGGSCLAAMHAHLHLFGQEKKEKRERWAVSGERAGARSREKAESSSCEQWVKVSRKAHVSAVLAYSPPGKTGAATTATSSRNTKNTSASRWLANSNKKIERKAKARTGTKAPRIFFNLLYEKHNPALPKRTCHPTPPTKNTTQRHPAVAAREIIRKGKRKRKICYKCATYTAWHGKAGSTMHTKSYAPDWEEKQQAVNADKESGENDGRINSSISQNGRFSPHLTVIYLINGCIFNFIFWLTIYLSS